MQTVPLGGNNHEMSESVFWETRININLSSAELSKRVVTFKTPSGYVNVRATPFVLKVKAQISPVPSDQPCAFCLIKAFTISRVDRKTVASQMVVFPNS